MAEEKNPVVDEEKILTPNISGQENSASESSSEDSDAVSVEGLPAPKFPTEDNLPDLITPKGTIEVTIYLYSDETKRIRSINGEIQYALRKVGLIECPFVTTWSVPPRDVLETYRARSSYYEPLARSTLTNRSELMNQIIKNHLTTMKYGEPGKEKDFPLEKNRRGHLSEGSLNQVRSLHPTILDILFMKYTDEAALII